MDIATPRKAFLSGFYTRSDATSTIKESLPFNLLQIVNDLTLQKDDILTKYEQKGYEEIEDAIEQLNVLRNEIIKNSSFRKLVSEGPDVEYYNNYLEKISSFEGHPTYQTTIRYYAECYMYRRVWEIFEMTTCLTDFDPYERLKKEQFHMTLPTICKIGNYLKNILNDADSSPLTDFTKLLKLNLWSSRENLLTSLEIPNNDTDNDKKYLDVRQYESHIISDQTEDAWNVISSQEYHHSNTIDIILDNVGLELFADLCIADFLITRNYARKINFHVKHIPWFLINTMQKDIIWMIDELKNDSHRHMKKLGTKWESLLLDGRWNILIRKFWCLPTYFSEMNQTDPWLYNKLSESKLLISKGDINYRKIVGEKNWGPDTSFTKASQDFNPTNIFAIRVVKSDLICGVEKKKLKELKATDTNWKTSGRYAMLQFAEKQILPCDCMQL